MYSEEPVEFEMFLSRKVLIDEECIGGDIFYVVLNRDKLRVLDL
jgi:hypothetical protein